MIKFLSTHTHICMYMCIYIYIFTHLYLCVYIDITGRLGRSQAIAALIEAD